MTNRNLVLSSLRHLLPSRKGQRKHRTNYTHDWYCICTYNYDLFTGKHTGICITGPKFYFEALRTSRNQGLSNQRVIYIVLTVYTLRDQELWENKVWAIECHLYIIIEFPILNPSSNNCSALWWPKRHYRRCIVLFSTRLLHIHVMWHINYLFQIMQFL